MGNPKCFLCKRYRKTGEKICFYSFPKESPVYSMWLDVCGITQQQERQLKPQICDVCFPPDSFDDQYDGYKRRLLKKEAVPVGSVDKTHKFTRKPQVTEYISPPPMPQRYNQKRQQFQKPKKDPKGTELESCREKCRCCLENVRGDVFIRLNGFVEERFYNFTSTTLSPSQKLSQKVCMACNSLLARFTQIKHTFIANQMKLHSLLEENPEEEFQDFFSDDPSPLDMWSEMRSHSSVKFEESLLDVKEESCEKPCTIVQSIEPVEEADFEDYTFCDGIVTEPKQEAFDDYSDETSPEVDEIFSPPNKISRARTRMIYSPSSKMCDECDYKCSKPSILMAHKYRKHGGPPPPNEFMCHLCPKEFKTIELMRRHLDKHNNVKRFACDHCEFMTHARTDMINHVRTHLSPASRIQYTCDFEGCTKSFLNRRNLRLHKMKNHTKEFPFQCHLCPKSFVQNLRLKNHMKFVHMKVKQWMCDIECCGSIFAYKNHLARHKMKIHKIGNGKICGSVFSSNFIKI